MIQDLIKARTIVRFLAMGFLSAGILWQLGKHGLLDLVLIKSAFLHSKIWIGTSLLQTTIVLAVQTFLGGVAAVLSLDRLRAVLKNL